MNVSSNEPRFADHMIMGFGAALATYSSLMSLGMANTAVVLTLLTLTSALVGHLLRSILPRKVTAWSGAVYAVIAVSMVVLAPTMNRLLPEPGFPMQIIMAGVFTWTVLLGGLACWRDSTLCFQTVPCIAIFGLVGAFDTFKLATLCFFLFLVCASTLFFRAHARRMVTQALQALSPSDPEPMDRDRLLRRMLDSGAWRWMAGPEWALGSALVIVVLSLFGAPVLQRSVAPITDSLRVTIPQSIKSLSGNSSRQMPDDYRVGAGPASFSNIPVLRVKIDQPRLLRQNTFDTFTGSGWRNRLIAIQAEQTQIAFRNAQSALPGHGDPVPPMSGSRTIEATITPLESSPSKLYVAGEMRNLVSPVRPWYRFLDGSVWVPQRISVDRPRRNAVPYVIQSDVVDSVPPNARASAPNYERMVGIFFETTNIPEAVTQLARTATAGAKSDYQAAEAIRRTIASRCRYNLGAGAVPRNENAAEYFLFTSKEGYCDLFATAMATMARSVGLPARICTGALIQPDSLEPDGTYTVRDKDFHMWAEVHFEGVGWVPFDATDGAEAVRSGGPGFGQTIQWGFWAPRMMIFFMVAAGISLLIGPIRGRRLGRTLAPKASEADRLFLSLEKIVSKRTRKPRRLNETGSEYLERVLPESPTAQEIHTRLEAAMFAGPEAAGDLGELKKLLAQLKKEGKAR